MKSKRKERLPPLTCPSPSLPGSSSPDRRLDSCSRRLRVWQWEREIRAQEVLETLFLLPTGTGPAGATLSHSLPLDPVPSFYVSLAPHQRRSPPLFLTLASLWRCPDFPHPGISTIVSSFP